MDASSLFPLVGAAMLVAVVTGSLAWYLRYTSYRHDWRCQRCAHVFAIRPFEALGLPSHLPSRPRVTCPRCGHRATVTAVSKA